MKRKDLQDLEVYQMSLAISDELWEIAQNLNSFNRNTIGIQLTRSADSISANISEGYGRYFYKETRQYCYIARGSLYETQTWLTKLISRKIVESVKGKELSDKLQLLKIKLNAYIRYIEKQI